MCFGIQIIPKKVVKETLELGDTSAVWFQIGLIPTKAVSTTAHQAGLLVAIDVCPYHDLPQLGIQPKENTRSLNKTKTKKTSILD